MKKIISTVLALCLLTTLCVPLNAFGLTYAEYVARKKAQASNFSVSIIFHKFYGGIELEFRPEWKIGNTQECFDLEDVYYTLDGSNPKNGTLFKSNPKLTEAKKYRIRAIALDDEYGWSIESDTTYTVKQLTAPNITTVSEDGVTYVNISSDENAEIYYTTDNSTPTRLSKRYTGEIALTDDTRIKAIAAKIGYVTSNISQSQVAVAEIIKFTCSECGNILSDTTLYGENGKAICEECYEEQKAKDSENELLIECNICGDEIAADDVVYNTNNQPLCQQCADEISENEEQYIELECPHCSKILEISEADYNERESIVCPDCMKFIIYEGEDTEYECFDCGETFYHSDTKVVENGKIYCPYCNCIVDGDFMETCYICGKLFYEDELISDEDDHLICHNCYDELQNEDEELFYIQCPYCEETFEDNEDIYDEDGYAVCPYCEGLIDTSEVIPDENEIEFATSDWAAEEVYEAYQNNLIPDEMLETALYKTISREEFAAVAVKLYENIIGEIPDVDIYDTPFTDCNYASEYNNYIAVAYELGITKGTSDTTFSPYENITREQLATMLSRVALPPDNRSVSQFADHNKISQYAIDAVYLMAMHDIIKGVGNNRFAPKETATKEQAIIISSRIYNSYNEW